MTFSSDKPLYHVYEKAKAMLEEMGFQLNEKKTRFVTNSNRQSVTGLTVNEKVTVNKEYKRLLRQELYYWLKFDNVLNSNLGDLNPCTTYKSIPRKCFCTLDGLLILERYRYCQYLMGKLNFVLQVEPENQWFQKAKADLGNSMLGCCRDNPTEVDQILLIC